MAVGGWRKWAGVVLVLTVLAGIAVGWLFRPDDRPVRSAAQAVRTTGGPPPGPQVPGPQAPGPRVPDPRALADSPEVVAAGRALGAEIDRRLASLLPALSGTEVIGEGVRDGCAVGPSRSDGSGTHWPAAECHRQVVKYLAVAGDPQQIRSRWEPALTAQGARSADTNASPRPGEELWYGFPRDGRADLLGVRLGFDGRKGPEVAATPGLNVPRPRSPDDGAAAWADRGSRPPEPQDQAAARAFASGRRLVVLEVSEQYFTGPEPG
ncbi:hypothetical protein [Kitasatospora sp. NPDC001547]|uniref:hypothetical protein n=1 Tax=Kitasatospora sp. NPDC001547 TaxID=3364015 RepID=UPI0036CEFEF2